MLSLVRDGKHWFRDGREGRGNESPLALVVKNLPANAGDVRDTGSNPGSGESPGGGKA